MAKSRKWSEREIRYLVENYSNLGGKACARQLDRSLSEVYGATYRFRIVRDQPRYTEEELEYVRANYAAKGPKGLSVEMRRSAFGVRSMAVRLGLVVGDEAKTRQGKHARSHWTEETLKSQSASMKKYKGPLSPSWKGGVCNVSEVIRGRLYSAWKKYVFQHDGYTCRLCGKHGGKMVVHHVRTFAEIRDAVIKQHPEFNLQKYDDLDRLADLVVEAHELKDGVTLCRSCHQRHHLENGVNCGNILPGEAEDNPQPSAGNVLNFVPAKVQRLTGEDAQSNKPDTSAPLPASLGQMR